MTYSINLDEVEQVIHKHLTQRRKRSITAHNISVELDMMNIPHDLSDKPKAGYGHLVIYKSTPKRKGYVVLVNPKYVLEPQGLSCVASE